MTEGNECQVLSYAVQEPLSAASSRPNLLAAALRRFERCIDVALGFVNRNLVAKSIRQVRECRADHFVATPLLEAAMQRLLVWVVLREHVPLCTRVQDPQHRVEKLARRNRLAARAIVRNVLLRKMLPDEIALFVGHA